jgi:hypothetical protein
VQVDEFNREQRFQILTAYTPLLILHTKYLRSLQDYLGPPSLKRLGEVSLCYLRHSWISVAQHPLTAITGRVTSTLPTEGVELDRFDWAKINRSKAAGTLPATGRPFLLACIEVGGPALRPALNSPTHC